MKRRKYPVAGGEVLGIDVGGVIIDRINDNTDTSFFGDNYLATTAVPGVFSAIRRLHQERFGDNLVIVSKAGPSTARRTREWLEHHDFYSQTGMTPDQVYFCLTRSEKRPLCQQLKVTHFIDDHLEVHQHLLDVVPHRFLFAPAPGRGEAAFVPAFKSAIVVASWRAVLDKLL